MPPGGPQSKALAAKPRCGDLILRKFTTIANQIMSRNRPPPALAAGVENRLSDKIVL
jgi:hypothetical protein